ncbi:pancreatic lipase-related protein 2-like [Arctopsyche grandis]|uniref:pancreatic lipase-related protein 2-like n=1 Tax=Arctopsyche grandis TaxID=121162 RepID=UPI00406D72FC
MLFKKSKFRSDQVEYNETLIYDFMRVNVPAIQSSMSFILACPEVYNVKAELALRLYTRKNPKKGQVLETYNNSTLLTSNFKMDKPVKFYCHGWTTMPETALVVKTFLDWDEVNVIIVDWSKGSCEGLEGAVPRVPIVGKYLGEFIDWLSTQGVPHDNVHIMAVSMGCHVAGIAGRNCHKGKISYITACDPIRDLFEDTPEQLRADDAKYVEVIHTNAGRHGIAHPIGTADFYPNFGSSMPGCRSITSDSCSHAVSLLYYLDSIDHKKFVSMKCANYEEILTKICSNLDESYLGGAYPKNISGIYYLTTNAKKPFYKG